MSTAVTLSPAALALFRRHVERHGQIAVDNTTRPLYRELAAVGLMRAVSTYAGGPESAYRLTKEGFERKLGLLASEPEPGSAA